MNIKAINGNNYDDFLDGFFGGGEYGVSRNGSIKIGIVDILQAFHHTI